MFLAFPFVYVLLVAPLFQHPRILVVWASAQASRRTKIYDFWAGGASQPQLHNRLLHSSTSSDRTRMGSPEHRELRARSKYQAAGAPQAKPSRYTGSPDYAQSIRLMAPKGGPKHARTIRLVAPGNPRPWNNREPGARSKYQQPLRRAGSPDHARSMKQEWPRAPRARWKCEAGWALQAQTLRRTEIPEHARSIRLVGPREPRARCQ
jgi:hypothetical protein